MQTSCRDRLSITLFALILSALSGHAAWSQTPPTIKIVVPYPPASGPDILSRLMAEEIGRTQGPSVVVENRPGGGTLIGTEAVARAAPDGNTVLLVANSFVVNPALPVHSVADLVHYAELIMAEGADAVLARADREAARREAEADRAALLDEQGADANHAGDRVELIRKHLDAS